MNRDDLENLLDELNPTNVNMRTLGRESISTRIVVAATHCFVEDKKGERVEQLRAVMSHWEDTGELPI